MTNKNRSLALKLVAGAAVIATAFVLRGLVPEIARYFKMRRM
jgi:Family of unknown function (DUF6893)